MFEKEREVFNFHLSELGNCWITKWCLRGVTGLLPMVTAHSLKDWLPYHFSYLKTFLLEKTKNFNEFPLHWTHRNIPICRSFSFSILYFSDNLNHNILQLPNAFSGFLMGLHLIFKKLNTKLCPMLTSSIQNCPPHFTPAKQRNISSKSDSNTRPRGKVYDKLWVYKTNKSLIPWNCEFQEVNTSGSTGWGPETPDRYNCDFICFFEVL